MATFQTLGELSGYLDTNGGSLGGFIGTPDPGIPLLDYAAGLSGDNPWADQPSVHKVTDFMARNLAAIPLHVYERVSDTDRRRVTDGPLAALLRRPSRAPGLTPFRFWYTVLLDGLLADRFCIRVVEDGELVRIPTHLFRFKGDALGRVEKVMLRTDKGSRWREVDPAGFIIDAGYSTGSSPNGTSPLRVLSELLAEHRESVAYRRAVWASSARMTGVVERGTPWPSKEARSRFVGGLRAVTRGGAQDGGTLLLEDGMTWKDRRPTTPKETLDLEGRKLTDIETASAYHIAPELVGAREGTFSNVKAYKEALYRDGLGSYIVQWEQVVAALVDLFGDGRDLYIEAHVDAKLRGSFEEQASVLTQAVGAPWMSRNEARGLRNLPSVEGGDELLTPLNMLEGGQTDPGEAPPGAPARDTGGAAARGLPSGKSGRAGVKAEPAGDDVEDGARSEAEAVFARFFKRQGREVLAELGAGSAEWWDGDRWDRELKADLYELAAGLAGVVGPAQAKALGFEADDYDVERTLAFLDAVAESRAGMVNRDTRAQIEAALAAATGEDDDDGGGPAAVFETAEAQRSGAAGAALVAGVASFARTEAGRQLAPTRAVKTWVVRSKNPRAAHRAMSGETVPVGERFSNGMDWPGDPAGGADNVAGCRCGVVVSTPDD